MGQDISEIAAQISALGKRFDREVLQKTMQLFLPLLAQTSRSGIAVDRDIAYGPDEQQRLDIYSPSGSERHLPVVVYIHGGGLVAGDKDEANTNGLVNSNVPAYFATRNIVGVSINYRLVPRVKYPEAGQDIASAVHWLRTNIGRYGGNPEAIFLLGHSAGGYHVAAYLYDPAVHRDGAEVAGAIYLSAMSEILIDPAREPVARDYYGDDRSVWSELEPLNKLDHHAGSAIPTFLITTQYDPASVELSSLRLLLKLCASQGADVRYLQLQDHNHQSSSLSLGTEDDTLGAEIRDFITRALASKPEW